MPDYKLDGNLTQIIVSSLSKFRNNHYNEAGEIDPEEEATLKMLKLIDFPIVKLELCMVRNPLSMVQPIVIPTIT